MQRVKNMLQRAKNMSRRLPREKDVIMTFAAREGHMMFRGDPREKDMMMAFAAREGHMMFRVDSRVSALRRLHVCPRSLVCFGVAICGRI